MTMRRVAVPSQQVKIPDTIAAMIAQMGGRGLGGAFVYVGASDVGFVDREWTGPSKFDGMTGVVKFDIGLWFRVNGKRGGQWTMTVAYDPVPDYYKVFLTRKPSAFEARELPTAKSILIEECEDIDCEGLQGCVERMYDDAIQKLNGGFIPLD